MKTMAMVRESLCWSCECRQCMQLHYNNITTVSTSPSTPLSEQVFSVPCLSHWKQRAKTVMPCHGHDAVQHYTNLVIFTLRGFLVCWENQLSLL